MDINKLISIVKNKLVSQIVIQILKLKINLFYTKITKEMMVINFTLKLTIASLNYLN